MAAVERMRKLTNRLPESDTPSGGRLVNERQSGSLQEPADSAVFRVNRNVRGDNPQEEYLGVDLRELKKLKAEVDVYVEQLPDEEEYEEY